MRRTDILEKKDLIQECITANLSKAEIARRLQCNIKTVNQHLTLFGIEYHGKQGWKKGQNFKSDKYIPFNDYIKLDNINTNRLRKKLIREGLKEAKCEVCKNTHWNGQPIPLEVHHKDGVRTNNELANLEVLCPNCHAQTSTYRGRNKKTVN